MERICNQMDGTFLPFAAFFVVVGVVVAVVDNNILTAGTRRIRINKLLKKGNKIKEKKY